jgi:hypothetical protein
MQMGFFSEVESSALKQNLAINSSIGIPSGAKARWFVVVGCTG